MTLYMLKTRFAIVFSQINSKPLKHYMAELGVKLLSLYETAGKNNIIILFEAPSLDHADAAFQYVRAYAGPTSMKPFQDFRRVS